MDSPPQKDISERALLSILYDFSASLIQISSLDELLWHVAREVVGKMGFEDCVIYLLEDNGQALKQMAAIGPKSPEREILNPLSIPLGRGVTGRVAASGEPLLIGNVANESEYIRDMVDGVSELCVPILFEGKVLGVVDSEDSRPDYYTQQQLEFLESVASLVGAKIEQLRLEARLRDTEKQLLQSQRLEIVGELTGGIAHDFNNLLMAILGGVQQARRQASGMPEMTPTLDLVQRAAERGAELTRRLSVFSRMEIFENRSCDINRLVEHAAKLIKHALDSTIELRFELGEGLWFATTEENFLEHALLNLSINGRDAMPNGGSLTIGTDNVSFREESEDRPEQVPVGEYVRISVTDTGTGMTSEVLAKAFDPFFTTKEIGRGTGLGLSMVYGFLRQSGGYIDIRSAVDEGTSVALYLARTEDAPVRSDRKTSEESADWDRVLSILVVEDDESVRTLLRDYLDRMGHHAVFAEDGVSAVNIMESTDTRFDVLISDIALPGGMHGRDVARLFTAGNNNGKVLYISGYAQDSVVRDGKLDDGYSFLPKPFSREALSRRLSEITSPSA